LPDRRTEAQFFACAMSEAAFDELDGALDADVTVYGQQQVHVIWHDDEFVQSEFALLAIVVHDVQEKLRGTGGLKQSALFMD